MSKIYFIIMGNFINDVKVKVDYDNGRDKHFVFKTITNGTEEDMIKTIGKALKQKIKEGEITEQNLRGFEIKSNDAQGFFSAFTGNIKDMFSSL